MAGNRPEKKVVRGIWMEEVGRRDRADGPRAVPLYFTLPGASGGDIAAMIDEGLVPLEENGAIADPEQMRIVAVEQSPDAVVELQGRFPGLKVLGQPLDSLLRSTGPLRFPEGNDERLCRAQVVNMDLNQSLRGAVEQGQLAFPALALVRKFAILHAKEPHVDWTLCLTLDARIQGWQAAIDRKACRFLASNFAADEDFSDAAKALLGDALHESILRDPDNACVRDRSPEEQQHILMVLVPKRIAHDTHSLGWHVDTVENLRYGGDGDRARMVTWVLRFTWDERASDDSRAVYQEALRLALSRRGTIDGRGRLSRP